MTKLFFLILGLVSLIGLWQAGMVIDPDFGWHLRMGELIAHSGLPTTDPFSYTMSSYPVISHEWLADVIFYQLYNVGGSWLLAVLFSLTLVLTLLIAIPDYRKKQSPIFLLLGSGVLLSFFGVRPQVLGWLLAAIIIRIILDKKWWPRGQFFLPVVILFWVNLHGSFALGLGLILSFLAYRTFLSPRNWWKYSLLAAATLLASLVNPYGLGIWIEVFATFFSPSLRGSIAEWLPIIFDFNIIFLAMLAFSLPLIIRYRNSISPFSLAVYLSLLLMSLSSRRHAPLWVIASLPLIIQAFDLFYQREIVIDSLRQKRFDQVFKVFLLVASFLFVITAASVVSGMNQYKENLFYPTKAITFLKTQSLEGRIFNDYNWGGYLIWRLPEQKVFVDGRMPIWQNPDAPAKESSNAYQDYLAVLNCKLKFAEVVQKYQIRTVLFAIPQPPTSLDLMNNWLMSRFNPQSSKNECSQDFFEQLDDLGFKETYQDKSAVIYQQTP